MDEHDALRLTRVRELARSGEARRIREAAGLSQQETADVVGTSFATISRWETGASRPRGDAALAWLSLLEKLRRRLAACPADAVSS